MEETFVRLYPLRLNWPKAVENASELHPDIERLRLVGGFKGYDQLKGLTRLRALWCFGIDAKALEQIAACPTIEELHLDYRLKTGDLRPLHQLPRLKILTINSCSTISSLLEISQFEKLEGLYIENFRNVHSISELSKLTKLKQLGVAGSIWTRMKIETLDPLAGLISLEYLDLTNCKVRDESLRPLAPLSKLRRLDIPNFYPMEEFAWLSVRLPETQCTWFTPYIPMNLNCERCKSATLVMLTGKGKPVLCSQCDEDRLNQHAEKFGRLRSEF